MQRKAFEAHYSKFLFLKLSVGLNKKLKNNPQVILVDGDCRIDDELSLFTVENTDKCYSNANDTLFAKNLNDDFAHEQNLIIQEQQTSLIMGCGHAGVVNIMKKAEQYHLSLCVGGYHLFNPATQKTVSTELLREIVKELGQYSQTQFYTFHCTSAGTPARKIVSIRQFWKYLKNKACAIDNNVAEDLETPKIPKRIPLSCP